jgi:hypothetical protein
MKKAKVCKDPNKEPYPLPDGKCIKKCKEGTFRDPSTKNCVNIPASNPVVSKVPRTKTSIQKFIKDIEKYDTANDLIENYKDGDNDIKKIVGELNEEQNKYDKDEKNTKSIQGFIYERLWDICIKLGITELADKHTTVHGIGNMNNKNKAIFKKINEFFDKTDDDYINGGLISGNSGGYSDITFEKNIDNKKILHLVSVKYIDKKGGISIKNYDIQNLCIIIRDREKEYRAKYAKDSKDMKNYEIKTLLFVKNKGEFIQLCNDANASSNLLIKYISPGGNYENVYDLSDLELHYEKLKNLLKLYDYWKDNDNIKRFKEQYLQIEINKFPFIPRFHQKLFIEKINALMNEGNNEILIGAIPRSGKTYIMAGMILRHVKEHINQGLKTFNNYVIITPAPNETLSQYIEAFSDHIDFDKYNIKAFNIKEKDKKENQNCHRVLLSSKQLLDNGSGLNEDKIGKNIEKLFIEDNLEKIKPRIIFLDEAHYGMGTENAEKIVKELLINIDRTVDKKCCKIFVSATYNKPKKIYDIKDSNVIKWDLNDIKFIKKFFNNRYSKSSTSSKSGKEKKDIVSFLEYFDDRFGKDIVNAVIKDRNKIDLQYISSLYQHFPEPFLITSVWDKDFLDKQRNLIEGTNYGFDMDKLFTYRKDGETFENEEQLIELLEYYLGYPLDKKITGIKCLKFELTNIKIDNSTEYPEIKLKLDDNIDHKFTDKELRDMDIRKYRDIIIKIQGLYYKSNWEWNKDDRNYKEIGFLKTRGILPRIRDVCTNECRTLQHTSHKTSQLWFLPGGTVGRLLDYVIFSLLQLLKTKFTKFYNNHMFFICRTKEEILADTKGRRGDKDNKQYIYNKYSNEDNIIFQEKGLNIKNNIRDINDKISDGTYKKQGLIILSGEKLILGVSLPKVDIVTLFTNSKSHDNIYQMMFRSMTEVFTKDDCKNNSFCDKKIYGFMVDLNPQRVLSTLNYIQQNNSNKLDSTEDEYITVADTMNIDRDIFINKFDEPYTNDDEKKKAIKKFSEEFFQKLFKNSNNDDREFNKLFDEIEYDNDDFDIITKEYKRIFSKFKGVAQLPNKSSKENDVNGFPSGLKGFKKSKDDDKKSKSSSEKKESDKKESDKKESDKKESDKKESENVKKNIKHLIIKIISLLSIIAPCFNDDECIILNNDDNDDNLKPIKYNKIIDLLNNIEKGNDGIITKDLFIKIFKDRVDDEDLLSNFTNDELFEFIKLLFNKIKKKLSGGNIKMRKRGGDIINIDSMFQNEKIKIYNIKNPEKLLEQINKTLPFTKKAKEDRGEVFTPMNLVNEMLDKLPEEVWKNKDLKWLDPSAGMGNFPVAIYMRLMIGLKNEFFDEDKRRRHILEEMLYMVELDKGNVFIMNKIFCSNTYKLNIFQGSFIEGDYKDFDIYSSNIKFNIIVGNPPYNQGGISSKKREIQKVSGKVQKTIWPDFISKSFKLLKDSGYLLFINPLSWLKNTHKLHNSILEKHIIYLELWDVNYSKTNINAEIPLSIFLLHNINNKKNKTTIKICNSRAKYFPKNIKVYLDKSLSIPLGYIDILLKLSKYVKNNNCKLEYKTKKSIDTTLKKDSNKKRNQLKYKTLEELRKIKADDKYCIDTYADNEYQLNITKRYHPDFDKHKIILSHKSELEGIFIDKGRLGICGTHNYYIMGNNLELIKKILTFEIIKKASKYTKYGQNFLDTDFFNYVPDLRKLGHNDITEDDFNKLIGI